MSGPGWRLAHLTTGWYAHRASNKAFQRSFAERSTQLQSHGGDGWRSAFESKLPCAHPVESCNLPIRLSYIYSRVICKRTLTCLPYTIDPTTRSVKMSLPFYLVNAFTLPTSPHSGNQAAVVVLPASHPKEADDEWKQLTARDFNFAETAFVTKREDGKWGLRWWTPAVVSSSAIAQ